MASDGGLLPEQIWDSADIPARELFFGRPAGSAMPLVWAHAEYLKLIRSLVDGRIFDMPPQTASRYLDNAVDSQLRAWRFNHKIVRMQVGRTLRIETLAPAIVHWSQDAWQHRVDTATVASGLGVFYVDLPTRQLTDGSELIFTLYWPDSGRWEGEDFRVAFVATL
jgi:glucoamylase